MDKRAFSGFQSFRLQNFAQFAQVFHFVPYRALHKVRAVVGIVLAALKHERGVQVERDDCFRLFRLCVVELLECRDRRVYRRWRIVAVVVVRLAALPLVAVENAVEVDKGNRHDFRVFQQLFGGSALFQKLFEDSLHGESSGVFARVVARGQENFDFAVGVSDGVREIFAPFARFAKRGFFYVRRRFCKVVEVGRHVRQAEGEADVFGVSGEGEFKR